MFRSCLTWSRPAVGLSVSALLGFNGCNEPAMDDADAGGFTSTDTMTPTSDSPTSDAGVDSSGTGMSTTDAVTSTETDAPTSSDMTNTDGADESTTGSPVDTSGSTCVDNDVAGLCFDGPSIYAAAGTPADVVLADFDGDGSLDLATALNDAYLLSVRFGDGAGVFGEASTLTTEVSPSRLAAAHLNDDDNADLIVVNTDSDSVQVWLSNGDGTFATPATYAVGEGPTDLAVADYTADARPDIVVANSGGTGYHALVNDGSGEFTIGGPYSTNDVAPNGIGLGSIAPTGSTTVDVFYVGGNATGAMNGVGDGTFNDTTIVTSTQGTDLRRVESYNLDGDGDADFIVVDPGDDSIHVFMHTMNAQFERTTAAVGIDPVAIARANIDEGTLADVLVANSGSNDVTILAGNGGSGLADIGTLATGSQPSGIAVGDLNGDGATDIVVSLAGDNALAVYLRTP